MSGAGLPVPVGFDAHVVGRRRTGNERYAVELASALAVRDDIDLVAYVDAGVAWPDGLAAPQLRRLRTRAPQLRIPLELPVRARLDRRRLLHVQYAAPPIAGVPVVAAVHDISWEDRPGDFPLATRLRLRAGLLALRRGGATIVTLSRFTRDRLVERFGFEPERVHVTPPGVRVPQAAGDGTRAAPTDRPYVLMVGGSGPRKNVAGVIRAVDRLRQGAVRDLELVMAGPEGRTDPAVAEALRDVGAHGWLHRLGHVPEATLDDLLRGARAVAYPSLYEGFGLPVLEALARGAVVVAADATAIPEAAGDGALLVDPGDLDALTEGLARATTDEDLRRRLSAAGPEHARAFTWERTAAATVAAYRQARSDRVPPTG